ncbi:MAG: O-antigen ligase family protein [Sulfurifustaceae bacterium]
MELFLLKVFALLRPIMFVESPYHVLGLNMFEAAAIVFSTFLIGAMVIRAAVWKRFELTGTDMLIVVYIIWCLIAFITYFEVSSFKELGKFILPFLTYIVAKSIIADREQYKTLVFIMIVGFILPVMVTAGMTATGHGAEWVNYWTGEPRYQGVYSGPHNMAHNMTFLLILCGIYVVLSLNGQRKLVMSMPTKCLLAVLSLAALYSLYESGVRTPLVGLIVFVAILMYFMNKRLLVIGGIAAVVVGAIFSFQLKEHFYYESIMFERTGHVEEDELASGRPRLWKQNLDEFSRMPIDRQLAGVGIGNSVENAHSDLQKIVESHNDLLEVLIQTGVVGFAIFFALNATLLRAILRLRGHEKHLFLAVFAAVLVMNFASNSYVSRFGLAQMYYFIMAYIELSRIRQMESAATAVVAPTTGAYR